MPLVRVEILSGSILYPPQDGGRDTMREHDVQAPIQFPVERHRLYEGLAREVEVLAHVIVSKDSVRDVEAFFFSGIASTHFQILTIKDYLK
jgi:hypothetical protein